MSMMAKENFRNLYYKQLGLKNVDQMKALEHLLKEDTIDKKKLKTFSQQYILPAVYRPYVWKVLLDIVPACKDSAEFVAKQRQGQFDDLELSLKVMRMLPKRVVQSRDDEEEDEKKYICEKVILMYLLEQGMISIPNQKHIKRDMHKVAILRAICQVVCEIVDDEVDVYWITTKFFEKQDSFIEHFHRQPRFVEAYLKIEDSELCDHLCDVQVFKVLPYHNWFKACFAQCISASSHCLERIWDKLIAGSCNIMVFVCVALLLTCSTALRKVKTADAALKVINMASASKGYVVVDRALELWDQHQSSLALELLCRH